MAIDIYSNYFAINDEEMELHRVEEDVDAVDFISYIFFIPRTGKVVVNEITVDYCCHVFYDHMNDEVNSIYLGYLHCIWLEHVNFSFDLAHENNFNVIFHHQ